MGVRKDEGVVRTGVNRSEGRASEGVTSCRS